MTSETKRVRYALLVGLLVLLFGALIYLRVHSSTPNNDQIRSSLAEPQDVQTKSPIEQLDCSGDFVSGRQFTMAAEKDGRYPSQQAAADDAQRRRLPDYDKRKSAGTFVTRTEGPNEFVYRDGRAVSVSTVAAVGNGYEVMEINTCDEELR